MNMTHTLPIFPLPLVVLPGEVAALHIFESRYQEMLDDCLAQPRETGDFVIVYSEDGDIDPQGCAVSITKILHRHDDGRRDILVEGRRRAHIYERSQFHNYDSALVTFDPDEDVDWDETLATHVYALHRQILLICTGDEPADAFYQSRRNLSFPVAACSSFDTREKRHLLTLPDENARLAYVKGHLDKLLPFLQRAIPIWKDILSNYSLSQMNRNPTNDDA